MFHKLSDHMEKRKF